jgi:hypothetical protein
MSEIGGDLMPEILWWIFGVIVLVWVVVQAVCWFFRGNCPECRGTGLVKCWCVDEPIWWHSKCPKCNGTRYID